MTPARLRVSIPSKLSKAEREALENYEKAAHSNPRDRLFGWSNELNKPRRSGAAIAPEPKMATDDGRSSRSPCPVAQVAPAATTSADNPARLPIVTARGQSGHALGRPACGG